MLSQTFQQILNSLGFQFLHKCIYHLGITYLTANPSSVYLQEEKKKKSPAPLFLIKLSSYTSSVQHPQIVYT